LKLFSQRKGLSKVRTKIQVNSIDDALRNRLWNVLKKHYWKALSEYYDSYYKAPKLRLFIEKIWDEYFKWPIDTIPGFWSDIYNVLRKYFFNCKWFKVYDFLEFVVDNFPYENINKEFMKECNRVLEEELSAYRFVGKQITQITAEEEIAEIEEALESPIKTVRVHLENALKLMSDRKSPDYRNSIKESISAVEALCIIVAQDEKATLGQALDIIEKRIGLHGALRKAFSSLYGYTSSAEGIRHALLDETVTLSFEDAKFMLVSCSAFINYLISKVTKAGIKLR